MQHDDFIGRVQQRARLSSRTEAEAAAAATLATLAERLVGGAAENLAAQLAPETARYMEDVEFGESFPLDEFFERVSDREGVDLPDAVHHARSVVSVLCDAVSGGAVDHVRAQLPEEWDPLFESGSEGRMRRASEEPSDDRGERQQAGSGGRSGEPGGKGAGPRGGRRRGGRGEE